ncbi:hypothetical protein VTJ04DRAFT_7339 [Mycothermus thermophilus]|uniref:uncharacterized protein n=1 Tax=Humicola insolens TaxID=85995 RepID=UPI0037421E3E
MSSPPGESNPNNNSNNNNAQDRGQGPPVPDSGAIPTPVYYTTTGYPATYYYYNPVYVAPPPYTTMAAAPAPAMGTAIAIDPHTNQMYQYVSGLAGSNRHPMTAPPVDPEFPAANLINSTGGAGCEPGFNYFFPSEHANMIVLKCKTAPWKLTPGTYDTIPYHAAKVPANVTLSELLAGFGANNPDKSKNQLWEVYPQGGGAWGWKEHIKGDDEEMMKRTVKDQGWAIKRGGKVPPVYLWITKN